MKLSLGKLIIAKEVTSNIIVYIREVGRLERESLVVITGWLECLLSRSRRQIRKRAISYLFRNDGDDEMGQSGMFYSWPPRPRYTNWLFGRTRLLCLSTAASRGRGSTRPGNCTENKFSKQKSIGQAAHRRFGS